MNSNLFLQGVELMLVGMGTVFVFLTLLVAATALMSRLAGRYFPDASAGPAARSAAPGSATQEEVAAISVAIAEYRKGRR